MEDSESVPDDRTAPSVYQHTWPFLGPDSEVIYPQDPTPSQISKALRSEFAETLPSDMP